MADTILATFWIPYRENIPKSPTSNSNFYGSCRPLTTPRENSQKRSFGKNYAGHEKNLRSYEYLHTNGLELLHHSPPFSILLYTAPYCSSSQRSQRPHYARGVCPRCADNMPGAYSSNRRTSPLMPATPPGPGWAEIAFARLRRVWNPPPARAHDLISRSTTSWFLSDDEMRRLLTAPCPLLAQDSMTRGYSPSVTLSR